MDIDKAFEVDFGVVVNFDDNTEGPFYTGGPSNPFGLNLPDRTIYVQHDASGIIIWRKFGNNVNDWAIQDRILRNTINEDLYIPADNTTLLNSITFDNCLYIDGEGYVI